MVTEKDKEAIIEAFKMVDVKKIELEHTNPQMSKWFRFGSYNGMMIASEIIKQLPTKKKKELTILKP